MEPAYPNVDLKPIDTSVLDNNTPDTLSVHEETKLVNKPLAPLQSCFIQIFAMDGEVTESLKSAISKLMHASLALMSPCWDLKKVKMFEELLEDFLSEKKKSGQIEILETAIRALVECLENLYPRATMKFLKLVSPLLAYYHAEPDCPTMQQTFLRLHKAFLYGDCLAQKKIKKKLRKLKLFKKFEGCSLEAISKTICPSENTVVNNTELSDTATVVGGDIPLLKRITYSFPISLYINEDHKEEYFSVLDKEYFDSLVDKPDPAAADKNGKLLSFDENPSCVLVFHKTKQIGVASELNKE